MNQHETQSHMAQIQQQPHAIAAGRQTLVPAVTELK